MHEVHNFNNLIGRLTFGMIGLDLLRSAKTQEDFNYANQCIESCMSLVHEADMHPYFIEPLKAMDEVILKAVREPQNNDLHEKAHEAIKEVYDNIVELHPR